MPRATRNSQFGNHAVGGSGNGGDDEKNKRNDDRPSSHAVPYQPSTRKKQSSTSTHEVSSQASELLNSITPAHGHHPITETIVNPPKDRAVLPPTVTPSLYIHKPPSITFSNLPVPICVTEIKIRSRKLLNGFDFLLSWNLPENSSTITSLETVSTILAVETNSSKESFPSDIHHPLGPIKGIIEGPAGRKVATTSIIPSHDVTKSPSIAFCNLPVPTGVKEIKIKAYRLQNGFSFLLSWNLPEQKIDVVAQTPLEKLINTVKAFMDGEFEQNKSHIEREEERRSRDEDFNKGL